MLSTLISVTRRLEAKVAPLFKAFSALSGIAIIGMVVVVTIDAFVRKVFGVSFYGAYDTVTYSLSILIFLSLVVCQTKKAHFSIDLLTARLAHSTRMWVYFAGFLVSVVVCLVVCWRLVIYGFGLMETHSTSMEFSFLPTYPFPWVGAICFAFLGFMLFVEAIEHLAHATGADNPKRNIIR